jgi:hypothetical protein
MEEEDVEKASDSGVAALITPASCTDGVSNASSQMDYISGRNGETSSSMRSTFVNTEDVHPFTCEHCSSALLNDESVDNIARRPCDCPPLCSGHDGEENSIEGPRTPEAWDVPSNSSKRLINIPASIFEQLPGYYWHGMEEILEEEGVELVVPWSVLDPDTFELH